MGSTADLLGSTIGKIGLIRGTALAEGGADLDTVTSAAQLAIRNMASIGTSLDTCTVPGSAKENRIAPGMAELVQMVNDGRAPSERSSITDTEADMLAQRLNRPYAPNIRGRAEAGRNTFYRGR